MENPVYLAEFLQKLVFSIQYAGRKSVPPHFHKEAYIHKAHSIHYIIGGKGCYMMNGTQYALEPGGIVVFEPGTEFEWSTGESQDLEFFHIRFDYQIVFKDKQTWIAESTENCPFPMFGMYSVARPGEVRELFERICAKWNSLNPLSQYRSKLDFTELWLTIVENIRDLQQLGDAGAQVEATLRYIAEHYRESLPIEKLARMAGLNSSYYSKKFKRLTGYNPKDYITLLRVNKAKEMLGYSDSGLKDIAHYVGFADEFYFSRVFKRLTGISPSNFAAQTKTFI